MVKINNTSGFTIIELLVAVFIMATGFLALSQMEFLSLRQKQMAEAGSNATNIIQAAADRDLAEMKRITLLNNQIFVAEANGNNPDYSYCDGSTDASACSNCPCNPLARVAPDISTTTGTFVDKDVECAAVALNSSDVNEIVFTTDKDVCISDYKIITSTFKSDGYYLLRRASILAERSIIDKFKGTSLIQTIFTVDLTYTAKSPKQFSESEFSLELRDNLAVQGIQIKAQSDDYSDTVPLSSGSWGFVVVPYIP